MQLCTFSKSEIYHLDILSQCPLLLNTSEAKHCPCRKRLYLPNDLRVLSCTHPYTWRDDIIGDPAAVKANIRTRINKLKLDKAKPQEPKKEPNMDAPEDKRELTPVAASTPNAMVVSGTGGLTVYDRIREPMDFIKNIGMVLYESKMFGCANVAQGRALAFGFITNKIDPFSWKARNHIIGGNITMSAEAMLADFRSKHGGKHRIVSRTPDKAAVELQSGREKQLFELTWAEAQKEDYVWVKAAAEDPKKRYLPNGEINVALLKDNYSTPRRRMQMLWARVISDAVGAMAPEVSSGAVCPEELGEIKDVIEGEIIDAEWEMKPVASENHNAAAGQSSNAASSVAVAAPETTAAPFTPSETPPSDPPAVEVKTEPSPVPPPSAADVEARRQQLASEREEAFKLVRALKDELQIPLEKWQGILAKRNVTTAKDLEDAQLHDLVTNLQALAEKRRAQTGKDSVSQWANSILGNG